MQPELSFKSISYWHKRYKPFDWINRRFIWLHFNNLETEKYDKTLNVPEGKTLLIHSSPDTSQSNNPLKFRKLAPILTDTSNSQEVQK